MPLSLRRDDRGVSTLWSFVGVVILIAAILGVYYGYVVPKFAPPPLRAQSGDSVQVDYVGTFAENGLVFDTSIQSIAQDNASYPKAFMFAWHGSYAPLPVTNSPIPGQLVRPDGGWDAQVVSIDDAANGGQGVISVHHLLTPAMVDRVGQKNAGGTVVFVVTAVDPFAGTYTLNYNTPTKGRTLVFQVTMRSITRTT